MNVSKFLIPGLVLLCVAGGALILAAVRAPLPLPPGPDDGGSASRARVTLMLDDEIPTMQDVEAKHLFVPERESTGENTFPDLVVKGVYVGDERNAVFSLKSKPTVNLRVWLGDEAAALGLVETDSDPRKPITDFLSEWHITAIDFDGVTVEHLITGEIELYRVDYTPIKHIKDSAQSGFGQGLIPTAVTGASASPTRTSAPAKPAASRPTAQSPQAVAGRVGAYMQKMSPQQRAAFLQQLNKQPGGKPSKAAPQKSNGAANTKGTRTNGRKIRKK